LEDAGDARATVAKEPPVDPPIVDVGLSVSDAGAVFPPPQTLATPPPPHVWGELQVPQVRVPPQPSESEPQFLARVAQVEGIQLLIGAFTVKDAFTLSPLEAVIWSIT
jgi:hypothetical protein